MSNETELLSKRYIDLSKQANRKGIVIYSDFLNLNEQNVLLSIKGKLETDYQLYGGYESSERKVAAFFSKDIAYEWEYPISCFKIMPAYPKFADEYSHRDLLGAVMNLGLERGIIGDILCNCNKETSYLFCKNNMQEYLLESLTRVKHTMVTLTLVKKPEEEIILNFIQKEGIVSSNRLDNIVACFCNCSRSEASKLILGGKVFVMGKEILHNTYLCKNGDIISIRSYGKYIFDEILSETKKGRIKILYRIYS